MKRARWVHPIKTMILCTLASCLVINLGEGFTSAKANERRLISDTKRYGSFYQKELKEETKESGAVVVGDPEKVEREPQLDKEVEDYDPATERQEERTENAKTFEQQDGTRVTKQYFEPIHKKENGKWIDIDDTLKKQTTLFRSDTHEFENEEGILPVTFNTEKIQVEEDIEIIPEGDLTAFAVKENAILYNQVKDQTDIQYNVRSNHLFQEVELYSKETKTFTYQIKTTAEMENKEGELHIHAEEDYVISAPILSDRDGKTSMKTAVAVKKERDGYRITYSADAAFMDAEDAAYPLTMSNGMTRASTVQMDTAYVRSSSPNITSAYQHLMVGHDKNGTVSGLGNPNIIGTARSFFSFDMPNLGANRRLISASLCLYKFSDYGSAEVPRIDVYDTNRRVDANTVTWNNQPSNMTHISSNTNLRGVSYKNFDITSAAKKMYAGQPTSIMLKAADESSAYYMLAFNSESTGLRPCLEIEDQPNYDFNPDMGIDSFHEYFRFYTAGYNQFKGISIDGIAKPNSKVNFDLYEKTSNKETKIKTTSATSSLNNIDPVFVSNPLPDVQKYTANATNYTTSYLNQSFFPKKDTLYNFRVSVEKDGVRSKELVTDGLMLYTVKIGENLQTIASHYGIPVKKLYEDNNTLEQMPKEGDTIFLDYPHENPYLSEDMYKPPTRISVYMAEYKYRGPNCVGKCSVADPVSVSTGNFYHESKDFTLSDFDELSMQRTYNSLGEANTSIFGLGFSSNLEQYLSYDKNENILYYAGDGKIFKFQKAGSIYQDDQNYSIIKKSYGFIVENKDTGEKMEFNGFGTLTSIATKTDNVSTISYDDYGKITAVNFGNKRVSFEYYPKRNLVKSITMPNNTKVQYKYNNSNQLIEFIDALGESETYSYDNKGKMSSVKTRNGDDVAQNTYDSKGRVLTQIDGTGKLTKFTYTEHDVIVQYEGGEKKTYTYTDDYNISTIKNSDGTGNYYEYENGVLTPEIDGEGRKTNHFYDERRQLIKTVYPDNTFETYVYDVQGNVTEHRLQDGNVEKFYFNKKNLLTSKYNEKMNFIYKYDESNRLIEEDINFSGRKINYEYDGNQVIKKTMSNGLVLNYVYDSVGNVIKEHDNNGRTTLYTYDKNNHMLSKTDALGNVESYAYDGNGNVTQYVDKLGAKTINTYDGNNNLIQTKKGTLTSSQTYDSLNRVTAETDEQGLCKSYEYDAAGNVIQETDIYGKATNYTYDKAGHKLSMVDALGNKTTYVYDINNLASETDALGNTTSYMYDELGREISVKRPYGKTETKEYDAYGNVVSSTNEKGLVTIKTYDEQQRFVGEMTNGGDYTTYRYDGYNRVVYEHVGISYTKYTYDMYGNEISQTNALGHTISKTYDALNRMVTETDGLGGTIQHVYDAAGHEIKTIDQNGHATTAVYDIQGFKLQDIDALGNATTYTYNELGQLATTTDARGIKTNHIYDAYNHEIKKIVNNITISFKDYDSYGRLDEEKTPNEGKFFVYDTHNRIIEEHDSRSKLITKKIYDKYSNVIKESDQGGRFLTYKYNEFNELCSTTDAYGRVETSIYDSNGHLTKSTNFKNESKYFQYDLFGMLCSQMDNYGNRTKFKYNGMNQILTSTSSQGVVTTNTYDAAGRNTSVTDSFTNKTSYTSYDAAGNVVQTIDKEGGVTNKTYDAKNQLIEEENTLGQITKFSYDAVGNIIKTTDAAGNSKQTQYNAFGLVSREVDERGFATVYEYNDKLLVSKIIDKNQKSTIKRYNKENLVDKETDQNGNVTTYYYDRYGNVTTKIDPNGNYTVTSYDILGNVKEEQTFNKVTTHTYDKFGYLLTTKENNTVMLRNTYDLFNRIFMSQNALDHTTFYSYDEYSNLMCEQKEGYDTNREYDKLNRLIKIKENKDKITIFEYDAMDRETKQTQNDKVIKASVYDSFGNIVESTENGLTKRFTYDAMNRIEKTLYPSAPDTYDIVFTNVYDETGNLIKEIDPYGNAKVKTYTPNGKLASETNENEHTIRFDYDGVGNLTKAQNAMNRIIEFDYDGNKNQIAKYINDRKATYTYDKHDHLTEEKSEYNKIDSYRYDVNGKLLEHTKPDGTKLTYTYDALGNKLTEGDRSFTYNDHNKLETASVRGDTITYTYDKFDRIKSVKQPHASAVSYEWDIYGNKTSINYGNKRVDYQYNDMNKITQVAYNDRVMARYTYDKRGNVATLHNGDDQTTYTYDKLDRRIEYNTLGGRDKPVANYKYTYDAAGNMLSETIDDLKNTYTYDEMNELKSSSKYRKGKKVNTEYSYDLYGNKTEVSTDGNFKRYHYNENNELTNIYTQEGNTDIYYDKNGNMRDILHAGGARERYEYDEYGQLTKVTNTKDEYYTYSYDAQGDRSSLERWVERGFDRNEWYEKLSETGLEDVKALLNDKNSTQTFDALRYQSNYLDERRTCVIMPEADKDYNTYISEQVIDKTLEHSEVIATSESNFHIYGEEEHLYSEERGDYGNQNIITYVNGNNNTVYGKEIKINDTTSFKKIEYDDFGKTDDIRRGYGYNGEALDNTGLIYLRARYYNPTIGQYIQADSYKGESKDIESQNRYAFVKQNPYKYVDKDGHKIMNIGGGISGIAGNGTGCITPPIPIASPQENMKKTIMEDVETKKEEKKTVKVGNDAMKKPKPEPCPPTKEGPVTSILNGVQMVLDVIGFIPGLGDIADGINAIISYLRTNYLEAIISIGCILFSVFGDTLLKPLKWAAGTLVQKVRKVKDKIKGFIPAAKSFIGGIADTVKGNWFLGKNTKKSVGNACNDFTGFLDSISKQADDVVFATAGGGSGKYTDDVVQVIDKGASGTGISRIIEELDNMTQDKIIHIIEGSKGSNHNWEKLVPNKNWGDIKKIIKKVMEIGEEGPYKSVFSKIADIDGHQVEVTYKNLGDGTIKISDAWIK